MKVDLGSFLLGISLSTLVLYLGGGRAILGLGHFTDDTATTTISSSSSADPVTPVSSKKKTNFSNSWQDLGRVLDFSSDLHLLDLEQRKTLIDDSSIFHIRPSSDGDLCWYVKGSDFTDGSAKITLKPCNYTSNRQKFSIDTNGRIIPASDPTTCVSKVKRNLIVSTCASPNVKTNQFTYDLFDDTLFLRNKGTVVLTVGGSNPSDGSAVKFSKRTSTKDSTQRWSLYPISSEVTYASNPCQDLANGLCALCSGDCDLDADCDGALRCADRSGGEVVPGCDFGEDPFDLQLDDTDFCFLPQEAPGTVNYVGECGEDSSDGSYLCGMCEGDCDDDSDCEGDLVCYQRSGLEAVPGCDGEGGDLDISGKDICYDGSDDPDPPLLETTFQGNPCQDLPNDKCSECSGDCDEDNDCDGDLRCADRSSGDNMPGCTFGDSGLQADSTDFCFRPRNEPGVVNYVGECGEDSSDGSYLCGRCEGDCDDDSHCEGDLVCYQRSGNEPVPGCEGEGGALDIAGKDMCYDPSASNIFKDSLRIDEDGCSSGQPCDKCYGPCSSNADCASGLTCFNRVGDEPVPGCVTGSSGDIADTNYCYDMPENGPVTYIPGDLTISENGLLLSTGLTSRLIATSGQRVDYSDGSRSDEAFHSRPDGAAVFSIDEGANAGGWMYVSNSEEFSTGQGGVGSITFDSNGNVINYEMLVTGTTANCGGGKTYWGTWVTCEESGDGQVWEVNPYLGISTQQETQIGGTGGDYESFAYDNRDRLNPKFYVTNDDSSGGMVRFTPDSDAVAAAESSGLWDDYKNVLTTAGTLHWLVLNPDSNQNTGTFSWTTNRNEADSNAELHYRNSEGIDIRNGLLYFVAKRDQWLFILDLDAQTYERSSTNSGAFNNQPDQVARILADDPDNDMLYFCEDGGSDCGLHARDNEGNFFSIIDGPAYDTETTGLGFSPDNKRMYISFQSPGLIFEITRTDGYPFGAHRLDIKYHGD